MALNSFLGKFEHVLDSKGRLAVPARFRDGLDVGSVITRGTERCLVMYPAAAWTSLRGAIAELPLSDPNARAYRRFLFAEAAPIELDAQGRVIVPTALRQYAGIDRNAIIVGMDTCIEIWSDSSWNEQEIDLDRDAATFLDRLQSMI